MEARKEELQKKQNDDGEDEMGKAREVIRDAVITKHKNCDEKKKNAQKAEDVLAYSRAVNQTDSSLQ
ncbi:hypothetical protein SASPL_138522 [Salvia splendens]|uniref:Uncharacterized protein n=1 Tax=Salvia splendens TaxID=180675 RepID=A0A8X8WX36_SALSN|nr:hypothetical protein SASPL_138522 [Salvia splendens]